MYFLTIALILLIIISYYLSGKDLFSPSVLTFIGYFICAIFAIYNKLYWNIDISDKLIVIMLVGWIGLLLGEVFVHYVIYRGHNVGSGLGDNTLTYIDFNTTMIVLFTIINIMITFLLWREIGGVVGDTSDGVISAFKNSEESLSSFMTQMVKITTGSAFVFIFIFIINLLYCRHAQTAFPRKNYLLLVTCVLYVAQRTILGGRVMTIAYIIGIVFAAYYVGQYLTNWRRGISIKSLLRILSLAVVVVVVFWAIKEFVGRSSEAGLLEYISRYLGGSYELFDSYLSNPPSKALETFGRFLNSFNKQGLTDFTVRFYHEGRFSSTGVRIGNTYSALRNYYNDFGIIGVFLMSVLKSTIFTGIYYKLRSHRLQDNSFLFIYYMAHIYTCVFDFFTDYFFSRMCVGYIVEIFIMYIIYLIICKHKIILTLGKSTFDVSARRT